MPRRKKQLDDDIELPETVSFSVVRCPGCGNVHIGLLDRDDEPISEMTLADPEIITLSVQLLRTVYPKLNVEVLTEQIKASASGLH